MDEREISAYLVKHLADYADPDELILDLCQKTGRPWREVESLLNQVRDDRQDEIAARRFPILALVALGTFFGGLGLIAIALDQIFVSFTANASGQSLDLDTAIVRSTSEGPGPLLEFTVGILRTLYYVGIGPFFPLVVGLSMVVGSLVGMRDTWAEILNRRKSPAA